MIAIITQARVNSSRLPNKIFMEAGGISFLQHHINRLKKTGLKIIVATTNNGSEKPIVDFCAQQNIDCFCGDENNVLSRYYHCAKKYGVTTIIRVTSDCPLIDGAIILKAVEEYKNYNIQTYYSNTVQRHYPRGMDYEIFSMELLEQAFLNATAESDKEHVTPYIWKNTSGNAIIKKDVLQNEDNSGYRITLDTPEDKMLLTKLITDYNAGQLDCTEIVMVLKEHPQLVKLNNMIEQKKVQ
jgi:spore coat polysaccharide biosynthesis protein SpsF